MPTSQVKIDIVINVCACVCVHVCVCGGGGLVEGELTVLRVSNVFILILRWGREWSGSEVSHS